MRPAVPYADLKEPQKPTGSGKRFEGKQEPDLRAFVGRLPCLLASLGRCQGPIERAHVRSRGAAGEDYDNLVPLCLHHHREQHQIGVKSFEYRYREVLGRQRLRVMAKQVTARFLRETGKAI